MLDTEFDAMREATERLVQHLATIKAGYCPHCGNAMTQRRIGRCQYAEPCMHRLNEIPSVIHKPPEGTAHAH